MIKAVQSFFFAMNLVYIWLAYQDIPGIGVTQPDFYNYLAKDMIYNTYDRLMMLSAEGRRRNIVESNGKTFNDNKPLFVRNNSDPR